MIGLVSVVVINILNGGHFDVLVMFSGIIGYMIWILTEVKLDDYSKLKFTVAFVLAAGSQTGINQAREHVVKGVQFWMIMILSACALSILNFSLEFLD